MQRAATPTGRNQSKVLITLQFFSFFNLVFAKSKTTKFEKVSNFLHFCQDLNADYVQLKSYVLSKNVIESTSLFYIHS